MTPTGKHLSTSPSLAFGSSLSVRTPTHRSCGPNLFDWRSSAVSRRALGAQLLLFLSVLPRRRRGFRDTPARQCLPGRMRDVAEKIEPDLKISRPFSLDLTRPDVLAGAAHAVVVPGDADVLAALQHG